jgi:hypothetical protein
LAAWVQLVLQDKDIMAAIVMAEAEARAVVVVELAELVEMAIAV